MNIKNIGARGTIFTLEYGDSVYLINLDEKLILCDTNEGPVPMKVVKKHITDNNLDKKELIIFNSHSDWDHIWGNCAFENSTIIGHELCRERMKEVGEHQLEVLSMYHDGNLKLKLPNLTFAQKLIFEDDQIEFIYAPGHTIDSAICFDKKDSVLYVGDLLESPIPVLNHYELNIYTETLELIKALSVETIITTHSGIVDKNLIDENLSYIKSIINNEEISFDDDLSKNKHKMNIKNTLVLKYDSIVKEKLGKQFNFKSYKREFWNILNDKHGNPNNLYWDIRNISYEDLEETFKNYISSL